MATDSRLRFGCEWDCCPKLLMMPRSDIAVAFSGDTQYAYPLILQMSNAIQYYSRSKSRVMDLYDLKGFVVEMFNHLRDQISDLPKGQTYPEPPKTSFILGGYWWRRKRFAIWLIHFDASTKKFAFRPSTPWPGSKGKKLLCMTGDHLDEVKRLMSKCYDSAKSCLREASIWSHSKFSGISFVVGDILESEVPRRFSRFRNT